MLTAGSRTRTKEALIRDPVCASGLLTVSSPKHPHNPSLVRYLYRYTHTYLFCALRKL